MFSRWCGIYEKHLVRLGFDVVEPSCRAWLPRWSSASYALIRYSCIYNFAGRVVRKFRNDNTQELPGKQIFPFIAPLAIIARCLEDALLGGVEVPGVVILRPLFRFS